jgi:hypothetical protein
VRYFRLIALIVLSLTAFSASAMADTVSMTFLGPSGNNSGGVYTYPYLFSVNGGSPVSLICDTYDNEVIAGETWQATVTSLLNGSQTGGGGLFAGQTQNYKAAGLIFEDILSGKISANLGNWAIWGLFSSNPSSSSYFVSSGALSVENYYLGLAQNASNSAFAGIVLYTPIAGTQSWKGSLPQEFIGFVSVPEPAEVSMVLFTLLLGAGALVFRKRLGLQLVNHRA